MKRFIGILLAVCMIITMLPTAFADSTAVAKVNGTEYTDFKAALKAIYDDKTSTSFTLDILAGITINEDWDCRNHSGSTADYATFTRPITINGNDNTIKFTGSATDPNHRAIFRFENTATVKNLTIDVSEATSVQRVITSKLSITAEKVTIIGNNTTKYGIIFGEGAGAAISNVTAAVTDSEFKNLSYGISDNRNGQDAKSVTITDSVFNSADVLVSASESVTFTGNEMDSSGVKITTYATTNNLSVIAKNNTLDEDEDNNINAAIVDVQEEFGNVAVAQIGSTKYGSLDAAIKDAKEKDTIQLLNNINAIVNPTADGMIANTDNCYIYIAADKKVTLDLNGYVISVKGDSSAKYDVLAIRNHGDLTITDNSKDADGKIELTFDGTQETANQIHSVIYNLGSLTINGGSIINSTSTGASPYGIYNYSWYQYNTPIINANVTINGGTISSLRGYSVFASAYDDYNHNLCKVNIIGGTLTDGVYYSDTGAHAENGASLSITGGIIEANSSGNALRVYESTAGGMQLSVSGGMFIGKVNYTSGDDSSVMFISGGEFAESIPDKYLAESLTTELYDTAKNPNAPYSYYKSVEEAKAAAVGSGAVIKNEDGTTIITIAVTFDANGGECDTASDALFSGETLASLPEATREGYTFLGWFTAKEGGTEVTTDTAFSADTTIYAQWEKIEEEEKKVEVNILPPKAESKPLGSGVLTAISAASNRMTITATAGEGGRITSAGAKSVIAGGKLTYAIITYEGYEIENVIVDGEDMGAIASYTFKNIRENHTISVTFKKA